MFATVHFNLAYPQQLQVRHQLCAAVAPVAQKEFRIEQGAAGGQ